MKNEKIKPGFITFSELLSMKGPYGLRNVNANASMKMRDI